jgi:hypothetical protein
MVKSNGSSGQFGLDRRPAMEQLLKDETIMALQVSWNAGDVQFNLEQKMKGWLTMSSDEHQRTSQTEYHPRPDYADFTEARGSRIAVSKQEDWDENRRKLDRGKKWADGSQAGCQRSCGREKSVKKKRRGDQGEEVRPNQARRDRQIRPEPDQRKKK